MDLYVDSQRFFNFRYTPRDHYFGFQSLSTPSNSFLCSSFYYLSKMGNKPTSIWQSPVDPATWYGMLSSRPVDVAALNKKRKSESSDDNARATKKAKLEPAPTPKKTKRGPRKWHPFLPFPHKHGEKMLEEEKQAAVEKYKNCMNAYYHKQLLKKIPNDPDIEASEIRTEIDEPIDYLLTLTKMNPDKGRQQEFLLELFTNLLDNKPFPGGKFKVKDDGSLLPKMRCIMKHMIQFLDEKKKKRSRAEKLDFVKKTLQRRNKDFYEEPYYFQEEEND